MRWGRKRSSGVMRISSRRVLSSSFKREHGVVDTKFCDNDCWAKLRHLSLKTYNDFRRINAALLPEQFAYFGRPTHFGISLSRVEEAYRAPSFSQEVRKFHSWRILSAYRPSVFQGVY